MNYLYYGIVALAVILALIIFILVKKANQKLSKRILESFGKIPDNEETDQESIKRYYDYLKKAVDTSNHIDDITWSDLDMDKVFARINNCHTSVGEEYLNSVLHEPNFAQQSNREKLIAYLKVHSEQRLQLQMLLAKLGKFDSNGLSSLRSNRGR